MIIPPLKSQGIKTKLVPWINDIIRRSNIDTSSANWIEPFFGTGVVGLNTMVGGERIVGDTNPHIINFYNAIKCGGITPSSVRDYLEEEGRKLSIASNDGYDYYKKLRGWFNTTHNPLDFLFLSRSGFNGLMRFNRKGEWNVPFCKKPNRFAPAYITKICNQVANAQKAINEHTWKFLNCGFEETIAMAQPTDIIYCDPPYYGRYADYFNGWTENDEQRLFNALSETKAHFILSTWHHNEFRRNEMIDKLWDKFSILTREHFYHSGGKLENRHGMTEALIFNFNLRDGQEI